MASHDIGGLIIQIDRFCDATALQPGTIGADIRFHTLGSALARALEESLGSTLERLRRSASRRSGASLGPFRPTAEYLYPVLDRAAVVAGSLFLDQPSQSDATADSRVALDLARDLARVLGGTKHILRGPGELASRLSRNLDRFAREQPGKFSTAHSSARGLARRLARQLGGTPVLESSDTNELLFSVAALAYGYTVLGLPPINDDQLDVAVSSDTDTDDLVAVGLLLSPEEEERVAFEPVWGLVERAIQTGHLPGDVENDLRLLRRMIDASRQLATDDGNDVRELISRKLDRLLPDVLDVALPETPIHVRTALASSASGADEADLLDEINAGFMQAALDLDAIAAAAPPSSPPKPYLPKIIAALERHTQRIEATMPGWEAFDTQARRALQSAPLRAMVRTGQWAATTASLTVAQTAAHAAGAPAQPLALSAAVSALASGWIMTWLYTRRRRQNPSLPGLPQQRPSTSGDSENASDGATLTPGG